MPKISFKLFSIFSFGYEKKTELILKPGESAIVQEWSWRKFGFIRKFYYCDTEGNLRVRKATAS